MALISAATLDIGANGQWKGTQGTITADKPVFSSTATWNDAAVTHTHIKANVTSTASAAASLLIDLQLAGVSQFKVTKAGAGTFTGAVSMTALTATTGTFSGAVSMTALTATTGAFSGAATFSSTVNVSGDTTLGAATNPVLINRLSNATTYGAITFHGNLSSADAGFLGIYGRVSDNALYLKGNTVYTQGALNTDPSTTTKAGFRMDHGTAPTTPNNGDMWSTTAGAFIRINGVTKTFTLT